MNDNYNEITDLGLAASLTASGFVVKRINKTNPQRVVFCFENTPDLQRQIELFWADELFLPSSTVLDHVRKLKSRIHSK